MDCTLGAECAGTPIRIANIGNAVVVAEILEMIELSADQAMRADLEGCAVDDVRRVDGGSNPVKHAMIARYGVYQRLDQLAPDRAADLDCRGCTVCHGKLHRFGGDADHSNATPAPPPFPPLACEIGPVRELRR